jgi:hypothetical protein
MNAAFCTVAMTESESFLSSEVAVTLDGSSVEIPAERRSFVSIRSYLESLALQQQRIVCSIIVDGQNVNLTNARIAPRPFARVEAETMSLNEVPIQLIKAALQQTSQVRSRVQTAIEVVLINDGANARELWWHVSTAFKEPLLTLSLLPDTICGPANGGASLTQLRKWQLQQLGDVIRDVDEACHAEDSIALSEALESRALPWLEKLQESLHLWHETILTSTPLVQSDANPAQTFSTTDLSTGD